jgi:phosphoadenosine phosphosulfate reductase
MHPTIQYDKLQGPVASAFARHERIAFHLSGGRDSLCTLHLLRPYWDRLTVYHLQTGDDFPETQQLVREAAERVPRFVLVRGRVAETRAEFGLPTDLMPCNATPFGQLRTGSTPLIARWDCCMRSIMAPMHERMLADGITLIVRGQRDEEYQRAPMRSGDVDPVSGIEVLYPIQSWTAEMVMLALNAMGVAPAPFYAHGSYTTPECMTCTGFWDQGRADYLREYHPVKFHEYQQGIDRVADAIRPHLAHLDRELGD